LATYLGYRGGHVLASVRDEVVVLGSYPLAGVGGEVEVGVPGPIDTPPDEGVTA
jgi:hypothetical protein